MKKNFSFFIILIVLVKASEDHLKTSIENTCSIDTLRIIFEFLNYNDFMAATKHYNLSEQKLNELKVRASETIVYGTNVEETYDWKYDVEGELFPMNMKQMIAIREPPMSVQLYNDGNLEVKSENIVGVLEQHSNIESFWIQRSSEAYVDLYLIPNKNGNDFFSALSINFNPDDSHPQFQLRPQPGYSFFHISFSPIFVKEILSINSVYFYFYKFDSKNIVPGKYFCGLPSTLFSIERNPSKTQITNIQYCVNDHDVHPITFTFLFNLPQCAHRKRDCFKHF